MKRKIQILLKGRINGGVTVYASLIIMLVVTLILTCFKSALASYRKADITAACKLSSESIFAGYSNKVYDEFDLFVVHDNNLEKSFSDYLKLNFKDTKRSSSYCIVNTSITEKQRLMDNYGINLEKQVDEYMKYGIAEELLGIFSDSEKQHRQNEALKSITDKLKGCSDIEYNKGKAIYDLVTAVEGLRTGANGFYSFNGCPQYSGEAFVKQVVAGEITMQNVGINDGRVFTAMYKQSGSYVNILEVLDNLENELLELKEMNISQNFQYFDDYLYAVETDYKLLKDTSKAVLLSTVDSINHINRYEFEKERFGIVCNECDLLIDNKRSDLGESIFLEMKDALNEMTKEKEEIVLCDTEKFKEKLQQYQEILITIEELAGKIDVELLKNKNNLIIEEIREILQKIRSNYKRFSLDELIFDYSNIKFGEEKDGLSGIKNAYKLMKDGLLSFILDGKTISDKTTDTSVLTTGRYPESMKGNPEGEDFQLFNKAVFNEYLFVKFNSFYDYIKEDEQIKTDTSKYLDYVIEYIIEGKAKDRDNLSGVLMKISLIREGVNLVHLITNNKKKSQAYTLAQSLVGFTGNYALIKGAQYLIMSVWAYGESIVDLRQLCKGEKIPIYKTDKNWQLSLDNLLKMNFKVENNKQEQTNESDKMGLGYEHFLRTLLFAQSRGVRNLRTIDAIELRMNEIGEDGFRMDQYLVGATTKAEFRFNFYKQSYKREIKFQY